MNSFRTSPDPCRPSIPQPLCSLCLRFRPDLPTDPTCRPRTVLLDVSTVARPGACQMAVPRTVAAGMCDG